MECDEVRPRLDAYLDGELPETERVPLRAHLQDCPDCGPEMASPSNHPGIAACGPLSRLLH